MNKLLLIASLGLLVSCGGGGGGGGGSSPSPAQPSSGWVTQFSGEWPLTSLGPDSFQLDLPQAGQGSVHYVTKPVGGLSGYSRIQMRYRVELGEGASIVPLSDPSAPSILTLYFQRAGDQLDAAHESFRWFATFTSQFPITAGEHLIEARFDQNWTAVQSSSRENNPSAYAAALAEASRVGFVLGGGTGLGHGIYATGPARIIVLEYRLL